MIGHNHSRAHQRHGGYGLLLVFALLALAGFGFLAAMGWSKTRLPGSGDPTGDALRQAKEALIAYAVSVNLESGCAASNTCNSHSYPARPGDLPCPDVDNNGTAAGSCGAGASLTNQSGRLGRLPWKTLGLADLRDEAGERLWYAVSHNFKNNTRTPSLNSDTPGSISLWDSRGQLLADGSLPPSNLPDDAPKPGSGVVAVIIAPGSPLTRLDGVAQQRSGDAVLNAINYLDQSETEDNAGFVDFTRDGFVAGPVTDAAGRLLVNDRILTISRDELMAAVEQRVAAEVVSCFVTYKSLHGSFPWPAPLSANDFTGVAGTWFGRFPDTQTASQGAVVATAWTIKPTANPTGCLGGQAGLYTWWDNGWKNHVLIQIQNSQSLTVDGQSAGRGVVVLATGRALAGQLRPSNRVADYLEAGNADPSRQSAVPAVSFVRQPWTASFNDRVAQ